MYSGSMSESRGRKNIAVFCAAAEGSRPEYRATAEDLGKTLAAGGHVVGVIPHVLVDLEVAHADISELHVVDTMHTRKALMGEKADAFLVLPGGFGTFEELFEVLAWQTLKLHNKPVVLLNVAGFYDTMLEFLDVCEREGMLRGNRKRLLVAGTVSEALELAGMS